MKILLLKNIDPSFDAYDRILKAQNHETIFETTKIELASLEQICKNSPPDFILINNIDIFSPNFREDALEVENFLVQQNIPVVIWDYEAPYFTGGYKLTKRWHLGNYFKYPNFLFFNIDSYWTKAYQAKGTAARFLPFGVDSRLENYSPPVELRAKFSHPLLYVGTGFTSDFSPPLPHEESKLVDFHFYSLEHDCTQTLFERLNAKETLENLKSAFNKSAPAIRDLLESDEESVFEFDKKREEIISKMLPSYNADLALYIYDFLLARMTVTFSFCQLAIRLRRLIPLGLRIFGEGGWNSLLPQYLHKTKKLSYPEMYAAFASSKLVYCCTKKLFHHNAHERIFHIFGVGGLALTDYREDLDLVLGPKNYLAYRSHQEAEELIQFYQTHEADRIQFIKRARENVFARHTYAHRIEELVQETSKHFGLSFNKTHFIKLNAQQNWIDDLDHPPKI